MTVEIRVLFPLHVLYRKCQCFTNKPVILSSFSGFISLFFRLIPAKKQAITHKNAFHAYRHSYRFYSNLPLSSTCRLTPSPCPGTAQVPYSLFYIRSHFIPLKNTIHLCRFVRNFLTFLLILTPSVNLSVDTFPVSGDSLHSSFFPFVTPPI